MRMKLRSKNQKKKKKFINKEKLKTKYFDRGCKNIGVEINSIIILF